MAERRTTAPLVTITATCCSDPFATIGNCRPGVMVVVCRTCEATIVEVSDGPR